LRFDEDESSNVLRLKIAYSTPRNHHEQTFAAPASFNTHDIICKVAPAVITSSAFLSNVFIGAT
jgi:hexokinase